MRNLVRAPMIIAVLSIAAAASAQQSNVQSDVRTTLMNTDRAWCQAVVDRDIERFAAMIAETATYAGSMGTVLNGREAFKNGWAQYFKPGGSTISWSPARAEVIGGGDVGYTTGRFERHVKSDTGQETVVSGEYLTIFRRQADGSWQVIFDTGSALPQ
jgi:ketosteroid isomerase-like protein